MMNKKITFLSVVILGLSLLGGQAFSQDSKDQLAKANELYDAGDCKQAISVFESLQKNSGLDAETKQTVLYKKAYCEYTLGDYNKSENDFSGYLKNNSDDDEARLKLGESQFNQARYSDARKNFDMIKSSEHVTEAKVFSVRSSIELDENQKALSTLNSIKNPGDWQAVVSYWKGVVEYHLDNNSEAIKNFKQAKQLANKESWVKGDAQSWLDRIKEETRFFHAYVTAGYISDSNIAQSMASNLLGGNNQSGGGQGGGQGGQQQGPPKVGQGTSISDSAKYASLGFTLNPYVRSTKNITTSVYYTAPFYSQENESYDYQTLGWDISSNFETSGHDWWGVKLQYLDAWYNYIPYQQYLILEPYYFWKLGNDWSLKFDLALDDYLKTSSTYTVAPSVGLNYSATNWLTLKTGISSTIGKGQAASYTPPEAGAIYVSSGSMFSNYTTMGAYVGFWAQLPWSMELSAQFSQYKTAYASESIVVPQSQKKPEDRADTLNQIYVDLNIPVIHNLWAFDISATITKNTSTGMQGLPSASSLTTYSYDRKYFLITTSLYY